jgi:hypothetical protein
MNEPMPFDSNDEISDHDLESRLRRLPRRMMSAARIDAITRRLEQLEGVREIAGTDARWWLRPVPLWRAVAASIALAGASVAVAMGIAHDGAPATTTPPVGGAAERVSSPAAIIFVEHAWPRPQERYAGSATLRGWRFMSLETGETLQ